MDGDRRAPAAAAAASVAAVLGGDDLLRDILLRLAFPHYLVHAALVSKRWLLYVSDPAFLHRFRGCHPPPRLLGFCVGYPYYLYEFVPLPQPPELATLSRRVASFFDDVHCRNGSLVTEIAHCRNGSLVTEIFDDDCTFKYTLLALLLAQESELVLPPTKLILYNNPLCLSRIFLPRDGGRNGITLVKVDLANGGREVRAKVYVLGSGGWGVPTTVLTSMPQDVPGLTNVLPPIHGKIFIMTTLGYTMVLDLTTARFFTLQLPNGVGSNFMLSCAEDSGLYLVNAKGFELSVWLHRMTGDNHGVGGWLLVDTLCVLEACTRVAGDSWVRQNHDRRVDVVAVGDNADFVFLDHPSSGVIFIIHLRSKVVQKVYHRVPRALQYPCQIGILPVMMIWPPIFPARNVGHDQEE